MSPENATERPDPLYSVFARTDPRSPKCKGLAAFCKGVASRRSIDTCTPALISAANAENPVDGDPICAGPLEEVSNESDGWYRIARYVDYPHSTAGLQKVTRDAANDMVHNFQSAKERLRRLVKIGDHRPKVYVGHPDDPGFANTQGHDDTTEYGGAVAMEAREDGFYVKIDWANEWTDVRGLQPWRFSPRWAARRVTGGIAPVKLLSLGLTPRPNLADAAAANEEPKSTPTMKEKLKALLLALGFSNERVEATVADAPGADAISNTEASNAVTQLKSDLDTANTAKTAAETAKASAVTAAANERKARATLIVDAAIANSRIPAADRELYESRITAAANEEAITAVANELEGKKGPHSADAANSQNLGDRKTVTGSAARDKFEALVNSQVATGKDWEAANAAVMSTKAGQEAYQAWQDESKPETETL